MSTPTIQELIHKMTTMESRIAALEGRTPSASIAPAVSTNDDEIPWNVIVAAVAAVLPGAFRIESIELYLPAPTINWWGLEGRIEHFNSHRIY